MSKTEKESGIRLFGRNIPVPECQIPANSGPTDGNLKKTKAETPCTEISEQQKNLPDLQDGNQDAQLKENVPVVNPKPAEDNKESAGTDQDKALKKPEKILQCPRCNSLETKFCYFNNYNVNQPRHFCKNCQRYWTAGGTVRNVPIGAGRRKNKLLPSQYRHILVNSGRISSSIDAVDSSAHQHISSLESSSILNFGADNPLCESMESMLNLRDQKRIIDAGSISCANHGEQVPSLSQSFVTNNGARGSELSENGTSNLLQRYPVPPWVLPWNSGWNNIASLPSAHPSSAAILYSTNPATMQWCPSPMVAIPNIPVSYWGGMPLWPAGTGTVSIGSNACLSPSSSTSNSCCSGNGSPTLGKHARETVFADEDKSGKCGLVPKTIRMDDPNEASKLRAPLDLKPENVQNVSNGDVLKI